MGVARWETVPAVDSGMDLTGGQIFADEPRGLGSALPRHLCHIAPQQPFAVSTLLGVIVLTLGLPHPVVNIFPAVPGKPHLLARFQ